MGVSLSCGSGVRTGLGSQDAFVDQLAAKRARGAGCSGLGSWRWLVVLVGLVFGSGLLQVLVLVWWGLRVLLSWWLCLEQFQDCGRGSFAGLQDLVASEQAGRCA